MKDLGKVAADTTPDMSRLTPQMIMALPVIKQVWRFYAPVVVTYLGAIEQAKLEYTATTELCHHSFWSYHHNGNAVDIRTKTLPDGGLWIISSNMGKYMQEALNSRLGKGKYTVLVNDAGPSQPHIHVQYNSRAKQSGPVDYDRDIRDTTV